MINKSINATQFNVNMQPVGRRTSISADQSLLEAAQSAGVDITSICGGIGACDSCKIKLIAGQLSDLNLVEKETFSSDEIADGYRLACQAFPQSDVTIEIPPESLSTPQRLQLEGQGVITSIDPVVILKRCKLDPPTITDLRSDTTRLRDAISDSVDFSEIKFDHALVASLSPILRQANWNCFAVLRDDQVISILPDPGDGTSPLLLGLAVDIGTTKIAAYLVNLGTGAILAKSGAMNPQIAFGEDVISRISYVNRSSKRGENSGRKMLQERLVNALNDLLKEMRQELIINAGTITQDQIVDTVVVGNTAMHHLFAGYPVKQLGEAPYVPAISEATDILARDLGLHIAPGAYVHLPPNIAGYVGADHIAMILATLFDSKTEYAQSGQNVLALDIGTNTEISLSHKGELVCCSCASGPAFEGAHIQDGMRAAPGAIERVQIEGDIIHLKTIADLPPVGICGSGILDSIAEMFSNHIIDRRGGFNAGNPKVISINHHQGFVLAGARESGHGKDIIVSRKDINEIQLAKGAIRAGIEILLRESGVSANQLDKFIVAGAFGTYIDIKSAVRIGMFPDIPIERFIQVGNAAGTGARQMLVSNRCRKFAQILARRLKYVELSNHPDFTNEYSKALFFPIDVNFE